MRVKLGVVLLLEKNNGNFNRQYNVIKVLNREKYRMHTVGPLTKTDLDSPR